MPSTDCAMSMSVITSYSIHYTKLYDAQGAGVSGAVGGAAMGALIGEIASDDAGMAPARVALQPDGRYLWVGNDASEPTASGVTVIDTEASASVAFIATGAGHHEIAFSEDSRYAFVRNNFV